MTSERHDPTSSIEKASSVNQYEQTVRKASFFLTLPEAEQIPFLSKRFNEEIDELFERDPEHPTDKIQLLWGLDLPSERKQPLQQQMAHELGDCLFYVVAGAMTKDIPLTELLDDAINFFKGVPAPSNQADIFGLDLATVGSMPPTVRDNHKPDYFTWQWFGIKSFRTPDDYPSVAPRSPEDYPGIPPESPRVTVMPDGHYALWDALTYVTNSLHSDEERYRRVAAEALGVMSAVAQARLDSSLEDIATKNTNKLLRRMANHTLEQGDDIERARLSESERPDYTAWENTLVHLIFSTLP